MKKLNLVVIFMMLPRAQVSAGRINEILAQDPQIREGKGRENASGGPGSGPPEEGGEYKGENAGGEDVWGYDYYI